jgi:hypothetical protein
MVKFTVESFSDSSAWKNLRFKKDDLRRLIHLLQIPAVIELDDGSSVYGEYAFLLLLYRRGYPIRL